MDYSDAQFTKENDFSAKVIQFTAGKRMNEFMLVVNVKL